MERLLEINSFLDTRTGSGTQLRAPSIGTRKPDSLAVGTCSAVTVGLGARGVKIRAEQRQELARSQNDVGPTIWNKGTPLSSGDDMRGAS